MDKLLFRLRRKLICLVVRSVSSMSEFQVVDLFSQNPLRQAEAYFSFADTSRQMKDLKFSVFSVALW
jgi:hypothetical protein